MKKVIIALLFFGFVSLVSSCGGGGGYGGGVYRYHHGYNHWYGSRGYYRDRVVVVDPDIEPEYEATPLPSGPADMPDMGMPDMDFGGFDDF
jgi:hypothetical protein